MSDYKYMRGKLGI